MAKPYRERAELFAQNPQGRIYGGFYPGQGFGTFGGGIDPGEDPQEAAAREFQEESGYPVSNVRPAPVDPYVEDWKPLSKKPEYANDPKFQERFKKFKGSRTHYFLGDIAGKRGLKDTGDSAYPFESVRFRAAPTVISKHEKDLQSVTDPVDIARLRQRLAVLQSLQEKNAMPFKSKAQQRFMFASEAEGELPKGTAKRWANETEKKKGGIEALPEKVKPMKKSAAEIAEKVCTPEEKAKCCEGEGDKKDEKKENKKPEDTGNPFAKKEEKPEDKKEEKSEDKGNPFAKKTAAQIAYTVLKTAAVPEGGYTDEQLHPANVAMSAMGRGLTGMAGGAGLGMLLGRLLGGRGASKMFPHIKGRGEADRIAANEVAKRLRLASKGPGKKFTVAPPSQLERDAGDYLGHVRRRIGQGAVTGGALGAITGAGRGAYGAAPMKEGPFLYPLGEEENDFLEQYQGKSAACATPGSKIRSKGKGQGMARGGGKGPMGKPKKKSPQDIANKVWTSKKK